MFSTLSPSHRDYYSIESVRYPGNVLVLDQRSVRLSIRGQSSQPAVDQYWAFIPAIVPPNYVLGEDRDNENNNAMELQDLKDEIAELKEEIAEKDSLLKDKDEEINQLKELIEALSAPTSSTVEPDSDVQSGQSLTAVVLFDFKVFPGIIDIHRLRHILKSNIGNGRL